MTAARVRRLMLAEAIAGFALCLAGGMLPDRAYPWPEVLLLASSALCAHALCLDGRAAR